MSAVPLGTSSYRRRGARTPEVALLNVILEKDVTNQVDGKLYFQRPGLKLNTAIGPGPIRGVYHKLGVLDSAYIVLSGTKCYIIDSAGTQTELGSIPGVDMASIDGSADRAIIVANGTAYSTDGLTLTAIVMPSAERITSVICVAGYFILTVEDSQHFFWLAPGDVDPDALSFASAENAPDNLVGVARIFDEIWFFGQQTTEVWQLSSDIDAPFIPIIGRMYEKGCANRASIAVTDNTLFWVSNELIVYRADTAPVRISDHSMEERLRFAGADGLRAWAMYFEGHTIYCLRAGSIGTFCFDVENPNWARWKTYARETWRAHLGAQVSGSLIIAGDDTDGKLWELDASLSQDDGIIMEREITGGIPITGAPVKLKNISLAMAFGWADIVGTATNPIVAMRFSDDGGNIWSSWLERPLGLQGKYRTQAIWEQMGIMKAPGRIFQWRVTDDCLFRVHYSRANEAVAA